MFEHFCSDCIYCLSNSVEPCNRKKYHFAQCLKSPRKIYDTHKYVIKPLGNTVEYYYCTAVRKFPWCLKFRNKNKGEKQSVKNYLKVWLLRKIKKTKGVSTPLQSCTRQYRKNEREGNYETKPEA